MRLQCVSAAIACAVCVPCALAQDRPRPETELKAALCIGYFQAAETTTEETRARFDSLTAGKTPQAKQKFRDHLDTYERNVGESLLRLQDYMRGNIDLDEKALIGTIKRGHLGSFAISTERDECRSDCAKENASKDVRKAARDCEAKCTDQWWGRARLCEDLHWLPRHPGSPAQEPKGTPPNREGVGPFAAYGSWPRKSLVRVLEDALKAADRWEAACVKPEFAVYFNKSTCHVRDLTPAHLADDSTVAETERESLSKLDLLLLGDAEATTSAYRSFGGPYGSAHGAELAAASERWSRESRQTLRALRDGRITWGEYNRIRKRTFDTTVEQIASINETYIGASTVDRSYVWQSRAEGEACNSHLDCMEPLECEQEHGIACSPNCHPASSFPSEELAR